MFVSRAVFVSRADGCAVRSVCRPCDRTDTVGRLGALHGGLVCPHACGGYARFDGALNVDINEITMNLVPFPKLHYLVSGLSPLYALADVSLPPRRLDQMFSDAISPGEQG